MFMGYFLQSPLINVMYCYIQQTFNWFLCSQNYFKSKSYGKTFGKITLNQIVLSS